MNETTPSNGALNGGAGAQEQRMEVDARTVAQMTLEFLSRLTMAHVPPHERSRFAVCESMLMQIRDGQLRFEAPSAPH